MDFNLPEHLPGLLADMDTFIEREIAPLQAENMQYFDQRREHARTDWDNDGIPTREWEDLLSEMRRRADKAGWLRYGLPASLGGRDGTNLDMAVIREHLAHQGLGLHNDLQNESSIVGNFPQVIMMERFGTDEQRALWSEALITGQRSMAFGLTEPLHGSDATWLETHAKPDGDDWVINGSKRFNTGVHRATHDLIFARTSGESGQARGITAFLVPTDAPGFSVPYYWWTFNMPTDHGEVELTDVRVPADAVLGELDRGLEVAQTFLHENRIRQAASSLGAAQYCIDRAAEYAGTRTVFGKPLSTNQAVQWPLAELQTEACFLAREAKLGGLWPDLGDLTSRRTERAGHRLHLTAREESLLVFMMRHPGEVLTRQRLYEEVWDVRHDDFSNSLEVHVMELRKKLEAHGPRLIHTIRNRGYYFGEERG